MILFFSSIILLCSVQAQTSGGRYLIAQPQNVNFPGQLFQLPFASGIDEKAGGATDNNSQHFGGQRHRREEATESGTNSEAKYGLRLLSPSQPQKRENGQLAAFSPSQIGEGAVSQSDYDTNQYSFDPFEAALTTVSVPTISPSPTQNQSITRGYQAMTSSYKAELTANSPAAYPTRVPAAQQSDENSQLTYGQDPVNEVAIGDAITKMIVDQPKTGPKKKTIATIDPVDAAYTTQVTSAQEFVEQTVRRTMPPAVEPNPESLNRVTENFVKTKNMDEKIIHNSYNITNITIINNYRRRCGNAGNSGRSCKPSIINRVVTNSNISNPDKTATTASEFRRNQRIDAKNRSNLPIFGKRRKEEKQSAPTENTDNVNISRTVEDTPRNSFTNAESMIGENHLMKHLVEDTLGKQDSRATATVPFSTTVVNSPDLSTNSTVSQTSAPPQWPEMNFSSLSPVTYALPPQNSFGSNQFWSSSPAAYPTQVSSFFGAQPLHQKYQIPPDVYRTVNQYPNNDIIGAPIGFPLPHFIIAAEAPNRIPISAVGNVDKKVGEIEFELNATVDGNTVNTTVHRSNTDILQSIATVTDVSDPEPSKVPEGNSSITSSGSTVPGVATALPQRTVSTGVGTVSPPSSTAEIPTPTANGTVTDVTVHYVHEPVIISSLKSRKKRIDKEEDSGKSVSRRFVVQAMEDFVTNAKSSEVGKPETELKTENSEKKPNDVNTVHLDLALNNQPTPPPPVTTVAPSIDISADQLPEDARLALKGYVDYPVYNSKKYVRPENPLLRANIIQQLPPTPPPPPPPPPPSSFPPLHPALSNLPPAVLSLLRERMEQLQMLAMLQYQQQLIRGQAPAQLPFLPPALPYNPYSQLLANQQQNAQQLQQQQHQQQQFILPQGRPYLAMDTRQQAQMGQAGTQNGPQQSGGIPQNIAPPTTFFSPQQSPNAPPGAFAQNQNLVEQRRLRSIDERIIDPNQSIQSQQPMATYTIGGRVLQIPIVYRRQTEGK